AARSFARHARWVLVTRAPRELPAEARLSVAPLAPAELAALAEALAPDLSSAARARVVRAAEGSPWALRQALAGQSPGPRTAPEEQMVVRWLGALRLPVPPSIFDGEVERSIVDELVARGVVLSHPEGARVHDQARDDGALDEATSARLAEALARADGPNAALEALRLFVGSGRFDDAIAVLDRSGERLLADERAAELHAALETDGAPSVAQRRRLDEWRYRSASEHGRAAWIVAMPEPDPDADARVHAAWLKMRFTLEDFATVSSRAPEIARRAAAAGHGSVAWEVGMMAASAKLIFGELEEASRVLAEAEPTSRDERLLRRAVEASIAARLGDAERALGLADVLREELPTTRGRTRANLTYNLALVFYGLQMPRRAARLFESAFPVDALATAALVGRRALEMDAQLAFLAGNLDRAEHLLARLEPYVVAGTPMAARRTLIRGSLALVRGRYEDARALVARGLAEAEVYRGAEDRAYGATLAAQLASRLGEAPELLDVVSGPPGTSRERWLGLAELLAVAERRSTGSRSTRATRRRRPRATYDTVRALLENRERGRPGSRLAGVEARLARKDPFPLRALRERAGGHGVGGGRRDASLGETRRLAEAAGAKDVLAEIALLGRRCEGGVRALVRASAGEAGSARALARCSVLPARRRVGGGVRSNDTRTLGVGVTRGSSRRTRSSGMPAGDAVVGDAWVGLERQPVLRALVDALVAAGSASKEQLVRLVWDVGEYHPLKRQPIAPRGAKLRARFEASTRCALDDGYLRPTVARARVMTSRRLHMCVCQNTLHVRCTTRCDAFASRSLVRHAARSRDRGRACGGRRPRRTRAPRSGRRASARRGCRRRCRRRSSWTPGRGAGDHVRCGRRGRTSPPEKR
ncbi:MAG: tetratricopeptide repeat protein, partial [Polyangiales bacterium]